MSKYKSILFLGIACLLAMPIMASDDKAAQLDSEVDTALDHLTADNEAAAILMEDAKGVLIFPDVVKAGLVVGAQYGEGALLIDGDTEGYYKTMAASYGLQAGAQKFGYAMIFLTEESMGYLDNADGWEVGVGPSIVVVDAGMAKTLTTATASEDVYVFFFDQKGLMAGMGIQGSKISKMNLEEE
ncbi:MAG: twin-arginine translocation pathway signal protein [Pseudomonadota bacterium]